MFITSYRGYGKSEGKPTEQGLKYDAQAALDYIINSDMIDPQLIFVFGRSLGGAVAIDLVSKNICLSNIKGLILENTFTSISDMVDKVFPYLS